MKIGIDISSIIYGTGVSVYTKNLVENLLKYDKKNNYILFGGSLRRRKEIMDYISTLIGSNYKGIAYPFPPSFLDLLWNRLHIINIESIIGQVDVFHSSDWTQPPSNAYKVTTIHDLVPILYPEWSDPKIVLVHKRRLHWVKDEVERIIVPSLSTKKDLVGLGFNSKKIVKIPEAPDSYFKPENNKIISEVKNKFGIKEKYLLSIGITPRKNTNNILKSFVKIKREHKNMSLVIVGHPYIKTKVLGGVIYTKRIGNADLRALYSGSECLVYPSLYEGFGLPVLEAYACGCPVLTSNTSSLPEVGENAAILVDPESVASITNGIKNAFDNKSELISKGLNVVKQYSWKKIADKTLNLYKKR